ncbi:efflux RND transporter permease subunit [Vibrio sp. SS-MA-C1-2]|uniref:efflux RND transporter permease subunit n=1 Tax=Vibrio sp. SS-MA-C1-2 TaxID=2908646 RepID=UPI0021A63801|nr:efflux RND transporter permease subunit [Vibrio sp. SS-MA-C1-2]
MTQRYNVLAVFVGGLILAVALVVSGKVRWVFFPEIPSDFIQVNVEMDSSSSDDNTVATAKLIEQALYDMDDELTKETGASVIKHDFVAKTSTTSLLMFAELTKAEERSIDGVSIADAWRDKIPNLVGVKKITVSAGEQDQGSNITFKLRSDNFSDLTKASEQLQAQLATYAGLYDISDDYSSGNNEIQLSIKPEAEARGLTLNDLASQVRYAFYGYEAQRILRDKEEVKVMIRFPLNQRTTIGHLEDMLIRTPDGTAIPFSSVADIQLGKSAASINRADGRRSLTVTASVNTNIIEPTKVVKEINKEFMPQLHIDFPDVSADLGGSSLEEQEALVKMAQGLVFVLFAIFVLMAVPLKSYTQPLIIMSVIPFGMIGALVGHLLLGLSMSMLSLFGIIALAGVVVNDSLVLVDYVNKERARGKSIAEAALESGVRRFRAIILTSLTTFFGLVPILLETSLQAQIMIPMAASLAFGILFSTLVTLLLVPLLYIILDDIKRLLTWWWQPSKD